MSNFKVGIDLGTTNSACCTMENGKFKFLEFKKSGEFLKSALLYRDGKLIIGENARKKSVIYPKNYISSSKTFMGNNDKIWKIEDKTFTPTEVATEVLKEIKSKIISSWKINGDIEAVITVPADFDPIQKKETKKAGEDAGFIVKQIITEPVSAAMAYGFEDEANQKLLIVDIGGGTFDVSVLKVKDGKNFDSKATDGDRKLGGDNFDDIIFEMFLTNMRKEHGINLKTLEKSGLSEDEYLKVIQQFKIEAEEKKVELSKSETVEVDIPNLFIIDGEAINFSLEITREDFEKRANLLFKKINRIILRTLDDEDIEKDSIDKIVLVGGSSYIPAIQQIIKDLFNKLPYSDKPLDKLVAMGAALKADDEDNTITLKEQNSHSVGIEVKGGKYEEVLAKGSYYSKVFKKMFTTVVDNQKEVEINVFGRDEDNQGRCNDKYFFGSFTLDNIQKAKAGIPDIEVEFGFNESGILVVKAKDLNSGAENSKVIITESQERKKVKPGFDIALLIDNSGSMRGEEIEQAKNACKEMINNMIDFEYNKLGLISFESIARILSNLTINKNDLINNISHLRAGGGTNMTSALIKAEQVLNHSPKINAIVPFTNDENNNGENGDNRLKNKIIILVTDGQDGFVSSTEIQAKDIKNKDIRLVTIGVGSGVNQSFLQNLASSMDDYYFINDFSKLANIFKSIMHGLQAK